jgi:hypothetical protein
VSEVSPGHLKKFQRLFKKKIIGPQPTNFMVHTPPYIVDAKIELNWSSIITWGAEFHRQHQVVLSPKMIQMDCITDNFNSTVTDTLYLKWTVVDKSSCGVCWVWWRKVHIDSKIVVIDCRCQYSVHLKMLSITELLKLSIAVQLLLSVSVYILLAASVAPNVTHFCFPITKVIENVLDSSPTISGTCLLQSGTSCDIVVPHVQYIMRINIQAIVE